MAREVTYEPHPISAERKAELLAKGFRIIDARFAPDDAPKPVIEQPAIEALIVQPAKKRGRPAKVASEAQISDKPAAPSED